MKIEKETQEQVATELALRGAQGVCNLYFRKFMDCFWEAEGLFNCIAPNCLKAEIDDQLVVEKVDRAEKEIREIFAEMRRIIPLHNAARKEVLDLTPEDQKSES